MREGGSGKEGIEKGGGSEKGESVEVVRWKGGGRREKVEIRAE